MCKVARCIQPGAAGADICVECHPSSEPGLARGQLCQQPAPLHLSCDECGMINFIKIKTAWILNIFEC